MFDIGFWELVVLFGLGLMVLGPERMPQVAAKLGRWAGQARQMARSLSAQLRDEIEPIETSIRAADQGMRKDFSKLRPDVGDDANPHADAGPDSAAPTSAEPATDSGETKEPSTKPGDPA